jgi:hypothetical protein
VFDTDSELDDCALLDALVNVDSDEDDDIIEDFFFLGGHEKLKGTKRKF